MMIRCVKCGHGNSWVSLCSQVECPQRKPGTSLFPRTIFDEDKSIEKFQSSPGAFHRVPTNKE